MSHFSPWSALVVLFGISGVPAADWPQFRGPDGQGAVPTAKLPDSWDNSSNIAWKVDLPGPGTSTPIVLNGKIYLSYYTGTADSGLTRHLLALDARNGKTIWDTAVPARLPEQERIREDHGYASSTPAVDGERIYAFFGKSGVYAFDLAGKQLWHTDVGEGLNGWGSATSPILVGDLVIVNASVESESLVALDKKTGREVWRLGGIKESWNTPIVITPPNAGAPEMVLAIFGKVLGIDPATGKLLWSCATDIGWYMVPSLVAHDGVIYAIGGRTGGSLAVKAGGRGDVTASHRLWTGKKGSNVSSPVFHDGHLYWMHENLGVAYCADIKSGEILYEQRIDRANQVYASAILADGKIYYLDRAGKTYIVRATPRFELLGTNTLGSRRERFDASPSIAGDRLYIRSNTTLYAIGQ